MSKNLQLEASFIHNFECKHLDELPAVVQRHYYYSGGATEGGKDGHIVQVFPQSGEPWIGTFAFGTVSSRGENGLYSWPDPQILCVVSQGQGYLVRVDEPTNHDMINVDPILKVIPVRPRNIVVFVNYTELIAYGKSGPVWVSDRLSWDGLNVTRVSNDYIEGEAWDPRVEASVGFKVNLLNGSHEGGSYQGVDPLAS